MVSQIYKITNQHIALPKTLTSKQILRIVSKPTLFATFLVFALVNNSWALGVGMTYSYNTEKWEEAWVGTNLNYYGEQEVKNRGLILDSATAKPTVFHFRIQLLEEKNSSTNNQFGVIMSGNAVVNDFGFAVFRNQFLRIWLGPRVKYVLYEDVESVQPTYTTRGVVNGMGIGPVIGVNFHAPKLVSIAVSAAKMKMNYIGDYYEGSSRLIPIEAKPKGWYVNLSLMLRIGDSFR